MGAGRSILDAYWAFLRQPVLSGQLQGGASGHLGAGRGLVVGRLVRVGGDVVADRSTGAAVSFRRREMGAQRGDPSGGQRGLLARLHGVAGRGRAGAEPMGRHAGVVCRNLRSVAGENVSFQCADLLGHRERQPRVRLLPPDAATGTTRGGIGEASGAGQAADASDAAQSAFSVQLAARDLRAGAQGRRLGRPDDHAAQ